jgi:hypothetical protein
MSGINLVDVLSQNSEDNVDDDKYLDLADNLRTQFAIFDLKEYFKSKHIIN